jgi:hypothetical protein
MYYNADRQDLVRSLIVYGLKCFVLSFELCGYYTDVLPNHLMAPFSFNSAIFSLLNPNSSPNTDHCGADPGFHLPCGIFGSTAIRA